MKAILTIVVATIFLVNAQAQGNSGKNKDKEKNNPGMEKKANAGNNDKGNGQGKGWDDNKEREHDRRIWDGIGDNSCMKPSKNQPAKVRQAFQRDYPMAGYVRWTKCRGDWTATFSNGPFLSTAVYHANGQRRDTRTPILRDQLPRRVLDGVIRKRPEIRIGDIIRIELPGGVSDIFRFNAGQGQYLYFNNGGDPVTYDY